MVAAKLLLAAGALCLSGASAQTILSDDGVAIGTLFPLSLPEKT